MGCCSSHEMDAEADAGAKWTEELPCQCSRQYSFTTSLTWETTHEAVQANIKCDLCGRQFRRTYEFFYAEKRKYKRWGYYGKRTGVKAISDDRFSFAHLEQCYALIEQLFLKSYGARKVYWAEEFYELVTAGEPNSVPKM